MGTAPCASSLASWVPRGRLLHLVDVENFCGGSSADDVTVAGSLGEYRVVAVCRAHDHVVVACGESLVLSVAAAMPEARILIGHGLDGADRALIDSVTVDDIARRFDGVIIGSGDHIFTELAEALGRAGVSVIVVAREESLSTRLARAARGVLYLSDLPAMRAADNRRAA